MPDYPRPCPRCGLLTEEEGFGIDRSKASGRKSHCRACDRRHGRAYYDAHREEQRASRLAAKEAAREGERKEFEKLSRERIAAAHRAHAEGVRRQRELFAEIGVPDVEPRERNFPELGTVIASIRRRMAIDEKEVD
jgi:hypothetical protein